MLAVSLALTPLCLWKASYVLGDCIAQATLYLEFLDLQHHCRSHLLNAVDSALECMAPGLAVLYTVAVVAHTAS